MCQQRTENGSADGDEQSGDDYDHVVYVGPALEWNILEALLAVQTLCGRWRFGVELCLACACALYSVDVDLHGY